MEAENRRQAELSSAREQSIFKTLLESPDPETQHLAIAGLLDSANPRRKSKGLKGWIGETQASPYLEQIRNLSPTVRTEEEVQGQTLPSTQMRAGAALPDVKPALTETAGEPDLGMAPNAPVEPGAPPPTPVSYTQSPPTPATFTRIAFRPRQVIMSPEQKAFTEAMGTAKAEAAVDKWRVDNGLPPRYGSSYLRGQGDHEGNVYQNAKGEWVQGIWGRTPTGIGIVGEIPAQPPTNATRFFGQDRESISGEPAFGGKPYAQQDPAGKAAVNAEFERRQIAQAGAVTTARGAAANQTKLNAPLPANVAAEQGVPFGTSMTDLKGITPVTEDQRKRHEAAAALAPQIDEIAGLVRTVFPPHSGLKGMLQASQVLAAKRASADPEMARLEGALNRAVGNIARVLNAESGRLTQQDVERAQKTLVDLTGFTDTQESALAKLADVDAVLKKVAQDIQTPGDVLRQRQGVPKPAGVPTVFPKDANGNYIIKKP